VTRRIGLSLGADICWPICYEDLMHELDLAIPMGGDTIRFDVRRVMIDPFDLRQPSRYDLVIDRLTHWYSTSREWIKKAILMDGLYVPPKEYEHTPDLQPTLERYAKMFDLGEIGGKLGYPLFMKPYDGGGWVAVTKVDDETELRAAYEKSGKLVMHLQKGVVPYEQFVRCVGLGPQILIVRYDPTSIS
jgi:hypothetical protein